MAEETPEKIKYKSLYLAVLSALNILPEDASGELVYAIADNDLDEDSITPRTDLYLPLDVFARILDAEADVIKTKLSQLTQGRAAGALSDGGFIEAQTITTQGQYINSHLGRVINVEVDIASGGNEVAEIWVKGELGRAEIVSRMAAPNYPLSLETSKGLYAMDAGENQLWFVGRKSRVSYLTFKRAKSPETIAELIDMLKTTIRADDEDESAILDIAISMVMPREGHHEAAGSERFNRGMSRLGMNAATKNLPDAPVKTNQRRGGE